MCRYSSLPSGEWDNIYYILLGSYLKPVFYPDYPYHKERMNHEDKDA